MLYDYSGNCVNIFDMEPNINIESFPRLAGETDDTLRIQRAFNSLPDKQADPDNYYRGIAVYFPTGEYTVSETITGTNVSIIGSVGTVFKGIGSGYMFDLTMDGELSFPHVQQGAKVYQWRDFPIMNCIFNGNSSMNGVKHSGGHNITIKECTFCDTVNYGLYINSGSKYLLENLTFRGISSNSSFNQIALYLGGSDHNVNNIIIANYTNGIVVQSAMTYFDQVHMWENHSSRINSSKMFDINAYGIIINNPYVDTIKTGIAININSPVTINNMIGLNSVTFGLSGATYIQVNNQNANIFVSRAVISDSQNGTFISVPEVDAGSNIKMIGIIGNCSNVYDKY